MPLILSSIKIFTIQGEYYYPETLTSEFNAKTLARREESRETGRIK
ncbi:MAG: hypothetical protein IJU48_00275 [Synergistaceae bacterium]|nr:hypothetical protein [Synergistaceae bacterium]